MTTADTHAPDCREDRKRGLIQMAAYKRRVAKSQIGLLKKEKSLDLGTQCRQHHTTKFCFSFKAKEVL